MTIDMNDRERLVEEINLLGPWTHGYFDLGNGIVIEDNDDIQKARLFKYKVYFEDVISQHYHKDALEDKTLCEIGCNTGYFIFEMLKRFNFRKVTGLEPRESNLAKARFIKQIFDLSDQEFELREYDILTTGRSNEQYDVVLMPGVLHHLDNHLNALKNLYKLTGDLCIIETIVLPEAVNSDQSRKYIELKDGFYRDNKDYFGLVGYKYESGDLDGSAVRDGIVAVPTERALMMMLKHVGFEDIEVYKTVKDLETEIYRPNLYRDVAVLIIKCTKARSISPGNKTAAKLEQEKKEIFTCLPYEMVSQVYAYSNGDKQLADLSDESRLVVTSQKEYSVQKGTTAWQKLSDDFYLSDDEMGIVSTLKHAFDQKVAFEYAKACYEEKKLEESIRVLKDLITICNLDWRTVYRTYFLLAVIYFDKQELENSGRFLEKSLRAYPNFSLAERLDKELRTNET